MSCLFPVRSLYLRAERGSQGVPGHQPETAGCESRCQGSVQESVTRSLSLGPQSIRAHLENPKQHKEMYPSPPRGDICLHLNFSAKISEKDLHARPQLAPMGPWKKAPPLGGHLQSDASCGGFSTTQAGSQPAFRGSALIIYKMQFPAERTLFMLGGRSFLSIGSTWTIFLNDSYFYAI